MPPCEVWRPSPYRVCKFEQRENLRFAKILRLTNQAGGQPAARFDGQQPNDSEHRFEAC
jgi:hypothetical protein